MSLFDYMDFNNYIVFNTEVMNQIEEANKNKNQWALIRGVKLKGSCYKYQALETRRLDLKFTMDGLKCENPRIDFDNQENLKTLTLKSPGIYLNEEGYELLSPENKQKFELGRERTVLHPLDGVKPTVFRFFNQGETTEYNKDGENKEIYKLKDRINDNDYTSIIIDLIEKGQLIQIQNLLINYNQPNNKSVFTQDIEDLNEKKRKLESLLASLKQQTMRAGSKKKKKFRSKRRKSLNKRKSRKSRISRRKRKLK